MLNLWICWLLSSMIKCIIKKCRNSVKIKVKKFRRTSFYTFLGDIFVSIFSAPHLSAQESTVREYSLKMYWCADFNLRGCTNMISVNCKRSAKNPGMSLLENQYLRCLRQLHFTLRKWCLLHITISFTFSNSLARVALH